MPSPVQTFRSDINGLRAWAVAAVIGFHFGISGFAGGFVGVDIFFVLSGFLMAGIVVSGAEKIGHSVSAAASFLGDFYLARARRILPALVCVCAALLVLGWFVLSPSEYAVLGKHIIGALAFLSNVRFSREAGYFDANSHEKALLHTWSLSVEWQFYLLFPVLILVLMRISKSRRTLTIALALLALASLFLSIFTSVTMPAQAFFLLPWRAWELLAGALVWLLCGSLYFHAIVRKGCELAGFALIIGTIVLLDESVVWPGWLAILPVLGTALILVAARQDSVLTGSPVAQWLGRSSYSLYLWHWPIVVALYYLGLQNFTAGIVAGLALTLLLGWLSYRFIETPARTRLARWPRPAEFGAILAAVLIVAVPSQIVKSLRGLPGRLSPEIEAIFKEADDKNPRMDECHKSEDRPVPECTYGGPKLGAIVIGDSHAQAIVRSVERALPMPDLHVLDWTMSSCRTVRGVKRVDGEAYPCSYFVDLALENSKTLSDAPLIIMNRNNINMIPGEAMGSQEAPDIYIGEPRRTRDAAFFEEVREAIVATACEFARTRPVYFVRPIPEMDFDVPKTMGRARVLGGDTSVSIALDAYHKRNAFLWAAQDLAAQRCGVRILDPLPYLCGEGRCWGASGGLPNYYDDDHLSQHGANLLIPMFRQIFEEEGGTSSGGPAS